MDMENYADRIFQECEAVKRRLRLYAGYIDSLMDGDTHQIGDMYTDLRADGFVDEDGFFIYDEEERVPRYKPKQKKVKKNG